MKPVNVKASNYVDLDAENNEKDPKFKLIIMYKYQKIKIFLLIVAL